ncbi:hypothetical protein DFH06DRAFT_1327127 [Mycena polygramma]|nr:hypothetical protein DFH06DRAFT_1327127 [Mycena polygramma]
MSTYLEGLARGTVVDAPTLGTLENLVQDNGSISAGDSIVEICFGTGVPLNVFPGVDGRLGPLLALRSHFVGTLWGVQVTKSTPITPFGAFSAFVVKKVRQKRLNGPYRLAGYSASTLLAISIAKLLEDAGEEVLQLSFIDSFPLLWSKAETESRLRSDWETLVNTTITWIIDLFRRDPLYGPDSGHARQWEAVFSGSPEAREPYIGTVAKVKQLTPPLLRFLVDFYPPNTPRSSSNFTDSLVGWILSVKAP